MRDSIKSLVVSTVISAVVASVFAVGLVKVAQKVGLLGAVDTDISANFYQVHTTDEAQFDGNVTAQKAITVSGTSTLGRLIQGGSVTALTGVATSTLTAAQVCGNRFISVAPVTSSPTITFPATTTLFANCLTSNGQSIFLTYKAVTTSSILSAGTGGTLLNSSATTVAAGKAALISITRDSASTYQMLLINLVN